MDRNAVLKCFAGLARMTENEAAAYGQLADVAIAEVEPRIRGDISLTEHKAALEYLCGVLCYYRYALLHTEGSEESIRALNVAVTKKSGSGDPCATARELRADALRMARGLLADEDFYFARA